MNLPNHDDYMSLVKRFRLVPIQNESQLEQAHQIVENLTNKSELSDDEKQYFMVLVELVTQYEHKLIPLPVIEPVAFLKYLMELNNLKAIDLVDIFGSRSVASEVLNGKRDLSKTHILKLAERFHVSPAAFFTRPESDPMAWRKYVTAFEEAMSARKLDDAQQLAEKAFEEAQKFGSENPRICTALSQLARVHMKKGLFDDAETLYSKALEQAERTLPAFHQKTQIILKDLAHVKRRRGDFAVALALYQRALDAKLQTVGEEHVSTCAIQESLAEMHRRVGQNDKAHDLLQKAITVRESQVGIEHVRIINTLRQLAHVHIRENERDKAKTARLRAIEIGSEVSDFADTSIDGVLFDLSHCYWQLGDTQKAREFSFRALQARERCLGPDHPAVASSLAQYAELECIHGKYSEAKQQLERALKIEETSMGKESPALAFTLYKLAKAESNSKHYAESIDHLKLAIANLEKQPEETSSTLNRARKLLAEVITAQAEAKRLAQNASPMLAVISSGEKYYPEAFAPKSYEFALKIFEQEEFYKVYAQYILDFLADQKELVHSRKKIIKVQQEILAKLNLKWSGTGFVPFTWCAISLATDRYFSENAKLHHWSDSDEQELRTKWYHFLKAAFVPSEASNKLDIKVLKSYAKQLSSMQQRKASSDKS